MSSLSTLALLGAFGIRLAAAANPLKLSGSFSGNSFFNGFHFNASVTDPTNNGFIHYVNQSVGQASSAQLGFVDGNGNVILKVDNTTNDPNPGPDSQFGRNTVMMISNDPIQIGTLVALDVNHIPWGCSVWPAFWTINADLATKPAADAGGEIDIIETVNLQTQNAYSLHTGSGCTLGNDTSFPHTGTVVSTNCDGVDFNVTGNQGCIINEPAQNSAGQNFAGGVYAMYWSTSGIQMWFFSRSSVPSDLTSNSPDPTSWPTASASYPANGCDPNKFFQPQNIIIDIDVCGSFAGNAQVFAQTCPGQCSDLVANASNYNNAYWEINSLKTFTANGSASASSSASAPGSSNTGGSGGPANSSAGRWDPTGAVGIALSVLISAMSFTLTL